MKKSRGEGLISNGGGSLALWFWESKSQGPRGTAAALGSDGFRFRVCFVSLFFKISPPPFV